MYVLVKSTKSKQQLHTCACMRYRRLCMKNKYVRHLFIDVFIGWWFLCLSKNTIGTFDLCMALHSYRKNCRMLKHILHYSAQSRSKFESDRCCATWYVMRERNIRNLITHRLPHSLAFRYHKLPWYSSIVDIRWSLSNRPIKRIKEIIEFDWLLIKQSSLRTRYSMTCAIYIVQYAR